MSAPWKPHKGQQEKFCRRSEFEVLFGGAAGPGKTECLIMLATRHVRHPQYKGLILRRTFPQLQEIIDRCWAYYPRMGGVYRATEHRWYFPSGGTITLGHMQHEDSKYQYQGKEYHYVGFDELTQFTETQYLYLISRARTTVPEIPVRIRATTNPGGIGHTWVKERFIDVAKPERTIRDQTTGQTRVFIPGLVTDNPTLFEGDPGYVERLELLPEIEKLRLRHGIWDAFEGQVFRELSAANHSIKPFDIPPEWKRYMVMDWGFAKPFCCHWYAIDYDEILYLYREWYGNREGTIDEGLRLRADQVAKGILEREQPGERIDMRIADPSIWHTRPQFRAKEALGATIQEDFANEGVFFLQADNDRMQGKQQVHRRLRMEEEIDTETGEVIHEHSIFKAFEDCHLFWKTVPSLTEDPKNPEDIDTKGPDHGYDAFRYVCMARPAPTKRHPKAPPGSFQAERQRLINAKKYARRRGVSVAAAWQKVR